MHTQAIHTDSSLQSSSCVGGKTNNVLKLHLHWTEHPRLKGFQRPRAGQAAPDCAPETFPGDVRVAAGDVTLGTHSQLQAPQSSCFFPWLQRLLGREPTPESFWQGPSKHHLGPEDGCTDHCRARIWGGWGEDGEVPRGEELLCTFGVSGNIWPGSVSQDHHGAP